MVWYIVAFAIGTWFGIFVAAMMNAAKDDDKEE